MKSASTYYREARSVGKQIKLRTKTEQTNAARDGYTARDREIKNEYDAAEMLRQFLATEI